MTQILVKTLLLLVLATLQFEYSDQVSLKPEGGNRHYSVKRPLEERKGNFKEINLGYSKEQAYAEASRCLRCDVRIPVNAQEE